MNDPPATPAAATPSIRMSTRSRSPVPPPGAGGDAAGAATAVASGAATITGTRSSSRRSSRMSMTDNSSGDSGKEDHEAVTSATTSRPPSATRKRGRPSRKDNSSIATADAVSSSLDSKNDTKNADDNSNNNNNENEEPTTTITTDENKSKQQQQHKPLVLLGSQPRGIYECDYCGSDLTRTPRIRCATCPDFDLCLECFASEDHEHMARYKREEEARRRKDAAKLAGVELLEEEERKKPKQEQHVVEKNAKRGRGGKRGRAITNNNKEKKEDDDDDDEAALGSYVGGVWVPYFRHKPDHGYIVADSTRYNLVPSFRGVKAVEMVCVEIPDDDNGDGNDDDKKKTTTKEGKSDVDKANDDEGGDKNAVKEESSSVVMADDKNDESKEDGDDGDEKGKKEVVEAEGEGSSIKTEGDTPKDDAMEVDKEEEENAKNEEKPDDDVKQLEHDTTKVDAMDVDSSNTKEEEGEGETKSIDKADVPVKEEESPEKKVEESSETEEKKEVIGDAAEAVAEKSDAETTDMMDEDKDNEMKQQSASKTQVRRYRVIDDSKNAWTAEEDLRLLDGILTCGLGNWPDIAEHVNGGTSGEGPTPVADASGNNANGNGVVVGGKTDKMCMYRYLDDFMGKYGNILPPYTMVPVPEGEEVEEEKNKAEDTKSAPESTDSSDGETVASRKRPRRSVGASVVEEDDSAPGFKKTKFRVVPTEELDEYEGHWPHPYLPPKTGAKHGEEVGRDLWYKSELSFVRQTTGACNKFDAERIRKEFMERRAQNLTGFEANVLPPRIDDQKELPGAELAGYMPRRGDFDMEWDNDAEKIISEMEFSADDTREDKNLKLDVIRIFNAKLDEREKRKQFIIDQKLLNYRENQEKMWKMAPDERHLVQRMRMFARFHTPEEHEAFVNKIIEAKRLRKEIAKLQTYRRLGITSLADAERYEIDKTRRDLHRTAWLKKEEEKRKAAEEAVRAAKENATMAGVAPPPPAPVPLGASAFDGSGGATLRAMANQSLQVWKQFKASKKESASSEVKASSGEELNSQEPAKFIIKDKPGYELLSKKEVGLCKRLSILPQDYLNVKKALISESIAQGLWSPQKSKSIFKIDVSQRDGVIDFVLEAGWIPSRPTIS